MAVIENKSARALVVGGVRILPSASAEVPNWKVVRETFPARSWLVNGVIAERVATDAADAEPSGDEPDEKDTLIAQIIAAGGKADRRMSLDTLSTTLAGLVVATDADDESE